MKKLTVLEKAKKLAEQVKIGPDTVLFGLQHLTPTNVELFRALLEKGLRPENVFVMGKCYSANPINYYHLSQMGIKMAENSFYFDSHRAYDELLQENVREFFGQKIATIDFSKIKKVILLDDGAALLTERSLQFPSHVDIVGIEQTSGGYNIAKKANLPFPVINVARSEAKLIHETPFITRMVCQKVQEHMDQVPFIIKKVLILGSGFIGRAVKQHLISNYEVDMVDVRDPNYCPVNLEKNLNEYQLIVGCAGVQSITMKQLEKVKGPIALISASSSDREFPSLELRQKIEVYHYFSKNIVVDQIHLINSGFPINFDDQFLDSYELELTRSLIFMAVIQAITLNYPNPGFYDVKNQKPIVDVYLENYTINEVETYILTNQEKEISYPLAFKLIHGMSFDAFDNFKDKVNQGFKIARDVFCPFGTTKLVS